MAGNDGVYSYWTKKEFDGNFYCPDANLFRFFHELNVDIRDKKILEIGFGGNRGADFMEVARRGGDIFGVDVNEDFCNRVESVPPERLATAYAGREKIPFPVGFSLIFSKDTIYYLSDEELDFFLDDCCRLMLDDGILVVQFIECDFSLDNNEPGKSFDSEFFRDYKISKIFSQDNPIRFLENLDVLNRGSRKGLKVRGTKRVIKSFGLDEKHFRVDRYIAFQKVAAGKA